MAYGIERFFLLAYFLACCSPALQVGAASNLQVLRQWPELMFVFPSQLDRENAFNKKFYVPGNSVPIDVDVQHRQGVNSSRIFVTIPRFDEGRPVTLGTVDDQGMITGYPNYSWHDNQGQNCDGLTSVFRTATDDCNRLWAMDSGKIGEQQLCPPQLVAFDLSTDQVVFRHKFDQSVYGTQSLFVTPVVDVRPASPGDCSDTFVYVADATGFGLVVVDVANNRSWRVINKFFYPYPSRGNFSVDGVNFDLMDGLMGMALSPLGNGLNRVLYFHALASTTENTVLTSILRNSTSFQIDPNADPRDINVFPEERPNQSVAEAMDRNGVLYFGLMEPPSIWCWNTATGFSQSNFHQIAVDREALQFATGVKIINNLEGEQELWVLTSSLQRFMTGSLSSDKINFRIHTEKISNLLADSPCLATSEGRNHD
ncbi:hypothetical protein O0L34_g4942 [Tuta absoluta]|nr:hypothetical protein O0L34_g4942 [Tuta absoluta]